MLLDGTAVLSILEHFLHQHTSRRAPGHGQSAIAAGGHRPPPPLQCHPQHYAEEFSPQAACGLWKRPAPAVVGSPRPTHSWPHAPPGPALGGSNCRPADDCWPPPAVVRRWAAPEKHEQAPSQYASRSWGVRAHRCIRKQLDDHSGGCDECSGHVQLRGKKMVMCLVQCTGQTGPLAHGHRTLQFNDLFQSGCWCSFNANTQDQLCEIAHQNVTPMVLCARRVALWLFF